MKLAIGLVLLVVSAVSAKVYFKEDFDEDWEKRWVQSEHKDDYGKFVRSHGDFYGDSEKDMGIKTSEDAKFYAISSKFKPFSNEGKDLVIQFSVKHEQKIDCGGGYLKLYKELDQKDMHGESPYNIMFGPDICGSSNEKVHVILSYKGNSYLIEKKITCKTDVSSHMYTLIIKKDNTYEVLIDNEKVESGSLETDWTMIPPKKIPDPDAKKPENWVDNAKMDDPEDKKPEDWDQPEHIPDPDATKPEDWDDDMDGEWEPPMIDNPEYKGEWKPRQIDNPDYVGPWVHPEIDNPDWFEDKNLYKYEFSAVGIDLWQVKSGSIFDNILITDDIELASKETKAFLERVEKEKEMLKAHEEEEEAKAKAEMEKAKEIEDANEDEDEDDVDKDAGDKHDEL